MSARLLAAVLVGAVVAIGCGDDEEDAPGTTRPATTAQKTAPAFSDFQPLGVGKTYTTGVFRPALRFEVPRGSWTTEVGDTAEHFAIAAEDPSAPVVQAIVGVHRVSQVYDPQRGGETPGDRVPLEGEFADWLRKHPRLRTTAPKPIELMGLEGVQIDVVGTRSEPPAVPGDCGKLGPRCVPLFYDGIDYIAYASTTKGRFAILSLPENGELVVEQFVEPAGAYSQGLELLRPLVAALTLAQG